MAKVVGGIRQNKEEVIGTERSGKRRKERGEERERKGR